MTTAHRPTYNPSKGIDKNNSINPSLQFSARDLPSNTEIKYRDSQQYTSSDIIDMKSQLRKRERESQTETTQTSNPENPTSDWIPTTKKPRLDLIDEFENINDLSNIFVQDKDVEYPSDADNNLNDSIDTEEEWMNELAKIKKEQQEEKRKKEEELKQKTENEILHSNPLLNPESMNHSSLYSSSEYSWTKKWYEDTIFRNQSQNEHKVHKRFINDTVRSDFHRKFLSKTIH